MTGQPTRKIRVFEQFRIDRILERVDHLTAEGHISGVVAEIQVNDFDHAAERYFPLSDWTQAMAYYYQTLRQYGHAEFWINYDEFFDGDWLNRIDTRLIMEFGPDPYEYQ